MLKSRSKWDEIMDKNLEQYLYDLEKSLKDFPPSLKAKVISEINSDIENSIAKYPDKSIKSILEDLGPASKLANHYRLDSGFKTFKPTKHPVLTFLTVGFLGTILISVISIGVLIWKFTPIIKIDEDNQRFMLLGGLIDINGKSGKIKVVDQYQFVQNKYNNEFEGSYLLDSKQDELLIHFSTGVLNLKSSQTRDVIWTCKLETPPTKDVINLKNDSVKLNFDEFGGGSCTIEVPIDLKLTVEGNEGEITLVEPEFDAFIDLNDGNILLQHSPEVEYKYSIRVKNGTKGKFPKSSEKDNAYEIQLELKNGSILYE